MDWNTETVNIIYASNDGYAGHLAASLYSLLDHNRNIPRMDIYILSVGMSEAYLERLAGVAGKFCRSLHVAELGNLRERFDYEVDTRGFDISAMGRLFAPRVLPDSVRKALYLDCDTIVNGSIRPLYETELGNHLAGMVMEPTVYREMKESIGMEKDEPYYNSGVLLMDLEAWRNQDVLGQLLEFYRSHQGSLFACDQDTINGALRGRIMTLPVRYNYFTNYRYFRYRTLVSMCGAYRAVGRTDTGRREGPCHHPLSGRREALDSPGTTTISEGSMSIIWIRLPGREPQSRRERGCTCTCGGCLTMQALSALPSGCGSAAGWE